MKNFEGIFQLISLIILVAAVISNIVLDDKLFSIWLLGLSLSIKLDAVLIGQKNK